MIISAFSTNEDIECLQKITFAFYQTSWTPGLQKCKKLLLILIDIIPLKLILINLCRLLVEHGSVVFFSEFAGNTVFQEIFLKNVKNGDLKTLLCGLLTKKCSCILILVLRLFDL